MAKWFIEKIKLPLNINWAISRSETQDKVNYIIRYEDQGFKGRGEVAFNTRYDETGEDIEKYFDRFTHSCPKELHSMSSLSDAMENIDLPNSLRFGLESAFVHFMADLSGQDIQELLGVNKVQQVESSISLPIMGPEKIESYVNRLELTRFNSLKIKVNEENAVDLVKETCKFFKGKVGIDANEGFRSLESVFAFSSQVKHLPIQFLEQPLPSTMYEEYLELKKVGHFELIADESFTNGRIDEEFCKRFHGVNIKLMKSGGYFKAIKQARDAKQLGLKTMLGCMIETTLGISSAINISSGFDYLDLDGFLFLENDPFNLIYEEKGKLLINSNIH